MPAIRVSDAIRFIREGSKGRVFSCEFVKRSTRELRKMVARYGVRAYVSGAGASYDYDAAGLVCVFDMRKRAYRMIPREGLVSIKINGVHYDVVSD